MAFIDTSLRFHQDVFQKIMMIMIIRTRIITDEFCNDDNVDTTNVEGDYDDGN